MFIDCSQNPKGMSAKSKNICGLIFWFCTYHSDFESTWYGKNTDQGRRNLRKVRRSGSKSSSQNESEDNEQLLLENYNDNKVVTEFGPQDRRHTQTIKTQHFFDTFRNGVCNYWKTISYPQRIGLCQSIPPS